MLCRCFIFVEESTFINATFIFLPCGFFYYFSVSMAWQESLWEYLLYYLLYYSHQLCSTFASSLRQNKSTKNILSHHVYISDYSIPEHHTRFQFSAKNQSIQLPPVKMLVWRKLTSESMRLLSTFKPAHQVTHLCYRLLFNYNYYFHSYRWLGRYADNLRVRLLCSHKKSSYWQIVLFRSSTLQVHNLNWITMPCSQNSKLLSLWYA